jgi:hypothetical protein
MPAKEKYLTRGWKRFSRVLVAILGSYLATMSLHVLAVRFVPYESFWLLTTAYSAFILWVVLMVTAFLIRKTWITWSVYLSITLAGLLLIL